jgi:hypothetical protein
MVSNCWLDDCWYTSKGQPIIDAALYKANKKSDRDGDGIACEK